MQVGLQKGPHALIGYVGAGNAQRLSARLAFRRGASRIPLPELAIHCGVAHRSARISGENARALW